MKPQAGDYGVLVKTKSGFRHPLITLITWATRSVAYHAVLVVDDLDRGLSLVEAKPRGVKLSNIDRYPNVVWSTLPLTAEQRKAISSAGLAFVGREYNFYDDAVLGVTRIFKETGLRWIWKRMSTGHSVECAQLVDAAYMTAGVHLFNDGRQTGQVAPSDLYELISGC